MTNEIQLVLSDIDGTLAPHVRHEVSDVVRQTIIELEEKGIVVAAVTGRPFALAKQTFNVLGISGLCVLDGGATIVDTETGANIWKCWLDAGKTRALVEALLPYSKAMIYTEGDAIIDASEIDVATVVDETPSIFALTDPNREAELVGLLNGIEGINFFFLDGVHPVTFETHRSVQITHAEATKHHGVEMLRQTLNIPLENTLAIGDGDNDLALFRSAAVKVAMGNGTDTLKQAADYVTGTLEDDGFVEAMEKFILKNK